METGLKIGIGAFIFAIGACIFSFLNVMIYRIPRKMSFVRGRSVCPSCSHTLGAADLVPVFSYLFLRGRCRYCKEKIGMRDTLVELLGGALALVCAAVYREQPAAAATVFVFFSILTVTAFIDMDTMEIPDFCWIAILPLAVVSYFTMPGVSVAARLIGLVCVSVPMLLLALLIPGAFGGGDIKLTAACGAFLGWRLMAASAVLAVLAGGLWGIYLLAAKKKGRRDHFAFGPFLCTGMLFGLLFGERLIDWYLQFLQV